ncbi:MAG: hypothetical protein LC772_06060, partial [Chloroflexi bacterium]|nr:hypothetical protein [Chloroflexota bacterium]
GRGERQLLTFLDQFSDREPSEVGYEIARTLAEQVGPGKRLTLFVDEVDGKPARESPLAASLTEAGFAHTAHGFLKRM